MKNMKNTARKPSPASAFQAYARALAADAAFTAALVRQYGSREARWSAPTGGYNDETVVAFEAKKAADAAFLQVALARVPS